MAAGYEGTNEIKISTDVAVIKDHINLPVFFNKLFLHLILIICCFFISNNCSVKKLRYQINPKLAI